VLLSIGHVTDHIVVVIQTTSFHVLHVHSIWIDGHLLEVGSIKWQLPLPMHLTTSNWLIVSNDTNSNVEVVNLPIKYLPM
jgi:hypothetical protein